MAFEERDDGIHFFADSWGRGAHVVRFLARAEAAGTVFAPRPDIPVDVRGLRAGARALARDVGGRGVDGALHATRDASGRLPGLVDEEGHEAV